MQEVEVTFGRAAQVWWAWLWRALLLSLLFSFIAGLIIGLAGQLAGISPRQIVPINMLLGAFIGVYVSIWILSKTLKKKFRSFRIAFIQI
ncbi:hypothetical protein [Pseudomonas cavernae]|uniref:hypothetical protein n=1 Tax=Pseudomonas cavernae TaxID=2320867 RepID=UPI0013C4C676|nr:hypothetical protein [Pseudomonas cavernae]